MRKEQLGRDADADALEDALCLVFLETQLADVAARLEPDTLQRVIVKTAKKMTAAGRALIADVPLPPDEPAHPRRSARARCRPALPRRDGARATGPRSRDTLAADVHRIGPYRDVFDGRDAYADFLEATITSLSGYVLEVVRMTASGPTVAVELNETVDDKDARLHTDECVVFDVAGGLIAHVAVYLQTSERRVTEPLITARPRAHAYATASRSCGPRWRRPASTSSCCAGRTTSRTRPASRVPAADHMRASWWRAVAVFARGDAWPHLYTEFPEGAPPDMPGEFVHPAVEVETAGGRGRTRAHAPERRASRSTTRRSRCGRRCASAHPLDAGVVLAPAKLTKTLDELECIRQAQSINERAMREVRPLAVPGARATDSPARSSMRSPSWARPRTPSIPSSR